MAEPDQTAHDRPRRRLAWRALGWFWLALLLIGAAGGGTLAWLGPPPPRPAPVAARPAAAPAAHPVAPRPAPALVEATKAPAKPAEKPPNSPIPGPDPALLETIPGPTETILPRIAPDGRSPLQVYAAGWDPTDKRPRVAVLVANLGMNARDSEEAISGLPAPVSFAVSPYATRLGPLLALARAAGHELLDGIPMEPQGYSLNDPGPAALMTSLSPAENAARLRHALGLFEGYVGATGAMGNGLHGERYAASGQMQPLLEELAGRGLLYIDPRPGGSLPEVPGLASRAVDLILDEPPVRSEVEARLAQLEQIARDRGSALGLAGTPSPLITERLAAWARGLERSGLVLVPVSALATRAKPMEQAKP